MGHARSESAALERLSLWPTFQMRKNARPLMYVCSSSLFGDDTYACTSDRRLHGSSWRHVSTFTLDLYVGSDTSPATTEQFALSAPDGAVINLTGELTFAFEVT